MGISLDVYGYNGKKLANLYDSNVKSPGSAHGIKVAYMLSGQRVLSFELPYMIDQEKNWRWQYVQAEYKIRLLDEGEEDWFIMTRPKKQKGSKRINGDITCDHLSTILKTKNLYLSFDETNGIGDAPYLMNQVLAGTGWTFDEAGSDVFRENVGAIDEGEVKKRSLESDAKTGAYELIGKVCDLFNAYPVFDAVNRSVALHDLNNKLPLWEMTIGRNLSAINVEYDSSSIVTRLYVQGDFDEDDYVGIDEVNPTGLSYLMNFDYYKQIGAFTDEHQRILDRYYADIRKVKNDTFDNSTELNDAKTKLTNLWGTQRYILWNVVGNAIDKDNVVYGGKNDVEPADRDVFVGDKVVVFYEDTDGKLKFVNATIETAGVIDWNGFVPAGRAAKRVVKWLEPCAGSIGAKENAIDAKLQIIESSKNEIEEIKAHEHQLPSDPEKIKNLEQTIEDTQRSIQEVLIGAKDEGNDVYDTFEYTAKVQGEQRLKGGDSIDLTLVRTSTNSSLSQATYTLGNQDEKLDDEYVHRTKVSSDSSISTFVNGTTLTFGDYGMTDALQYSDDKIEGYMPIGKDDILDCSTAGKDFKLTVNGAEDKTVIVANGTTFTLTVSARAYGLYEQYAKAIDLADRVFKLESNYRGNVNKQNDIEAQFVLAMGDMLKDGSWTDDNYIVGQEAYLYNDALDVMKQVSKPTVKYSVDMFKLSEAMGQTPDAMELNSKIRLYDPDLMINDIVYVSKITKYIDDLSKSEVEISNEEVDVSSSFDGIFSRINDIANLVERKKSVYDRASAISSGGMLNADRLEGTISAVTNQLGSAVSSWYTDDNGNIVFESVDGQSAMKLCGEGLMIANGKTSTGAWNWRTASTGKGIVGDSIVAGSVMAEQIATGTITANKLASDVGSSLDLSSNDSINLTVKKIIDEGSEYYLRIDSSNGYVLTQDRTSTTLTPHVFHRTSEGDVEITGNYEQISFIYEDQKNPWKRYTGDTVADDLWHNKRTTEKDGVIVVSTEDFSASATFECTVKVKQDTGTKDKDGNKIFEDYYYSSSVSVTNVFDYVAQLYVNSNHPTAQIFDHNNGAKYIPDWQQNPLELKPVVYFKGQEVSLETDPDLSLLWSVSYGGATENIDSSMVHDGVLLVTKNVLNTMQDSVTYRCRVIYKNNMVAEQSLTYRLYQTASKQTFCNISGGHVFVYDKSGSYYPNNIALNCSVSNATFSRWQYLVGQTYQDISWQKTFEFPNNDAYFTDDVCHIRAVAKLGNGQEIYDEHTILRLRVTGVDKGYAYHAYLAYSAYPDGKDMRYVYDTNMKYIGLYSGICADRSQLSYVSYHWTKLTDSTPLTVLSSKNYYLQQQYGWEIYNDDNRWTEEWDITAQNIDRSKYTYVKTVVKFSNDQEQIFNTTFSNNLGTSSILRKNIYIKYSANNDGHDMTSGQVESSAYYGFAVTTASSAPSSYTAYSWMPLSDAEKQVTSSTFLYIVNDGELPGTDAAWLSYIPEGAVSSGKTVWVKSIVTYGDNQTYESVRQTYTGTDAENTGHVYIDDELLYFSADKTGKLSLSKNYINICGYAGAEKVAPVVNVGKISGAPNGVKFSITAGNENETQLCLAVSDGLTFGSQTDATGTITIPVSVMKDEFVILDTTVELKWVKINRLTDEESSVVMRLYTPTHNVFCEHTSSDTALRAFAYYGGDQIETNFRWYQYRYNDSAKALQWMSVGSYDKQLTVNKGGVAYTGIYKCEFDYGGKTYGDSFVIMDKTDAYWSRPMCSAGTSVRDGDKAMLLCEMYNALELINRNDAQFRWGEFNANLSSVYFPHTSDSVEITSDDISGRSSTFVCYSKYGANEVYSAIKLQKLENDIYVSDTAPPMQERYADMLWLDTSVRDGLLKRWYVGTKEITPSVLGIAVLGSTVLGNETAFAASDSRWINVNSDTTKLQDDVLSMSSQLEVLQDQIGMRVEKTVYNSDINKIYQNISEASLTDEQFRVKFDYLEKESINDRIDDVTNGLAEYKGQVSNYMQYDNTGTLTLGSSANDFKAKLTNQKLAFTQADQQVAYFASTDMYIRNARVTNTLSIGSKENDYGYADWVIDEYGMGIKWRNESLKTQA